MKDRLKKSLEEFINEKEITIDVWDVDLTLQTYYNEFLEHTGRKELVKQGIHLDIMHFEKTEPKPDTSAWNSLIKMLDPLETGNKKVDPDDLTAYMNLLKKAFSDSAEWKLLYNWSIVYWKVKSKWGAIYRELFKE